jgi:hypothetical protein
MRRIISLVLLATFLNFEISYALVEVTNSDGNRGDGDKKAGSTESNKNSSGSMPSDANSAESSAQPNPPRLNIPSYLSWSESEIDSVFASFAVPPANIPVLENALGDVVQDSVVNILDLLRVRDIAIGRGPAASAYEMQEGDLNGDSTVTSDDVVYMRDVLLQKVGVPHVIGSSGGQVVGNGGRTTYTFPPGSFKEQKRLCVEDYSAEEFQKQTGVNLASVPGVDFLTGAKVVILNPSENDPSIPSNFTLREEVPPGAVIDTIGNNALYTLVSDLDGDGTPELIRNGDLRPEIVKTNRPSTIASKASDSTRLSMVFDAVERIDLTGFNLVQYDWITRTVTIQQSQDIESGMTVALWGTGWNSIFTYDYRVGATTDDAPNDTTFLHVDTFLADNPSSYNSIRGVLITLPFVQTATTLNLFVRSLLNDTDSQTITMQIFSPAASVGPEMKKRLLTYYAMLDTIFVTTLDDSISQLIFAGDGLDPVEVLSEFRSGIESLRAIPEADIDQTELAKAVRYFDNGDLAELFPAYLELLGGPEMLSATSKLSGTNDLEKDLLDLLSCKGIDPNTIICPATCILKVTAVKLAFRKICGKIKKSGCKLLKCEAGDASPLNPLCKLCEKGFDEIFCKTLREYIDRAEDKCLECCCGGQYEKIWRRVDRILNGIGDINTPQGTNVCIHKDWVDYSGAINFTRGRANKNKIFEASEAIFETTNDVEGIIVSVNNSPIPAFSHGFTGKTGRVLIPIGLVTGNVTIKAYDPKTGFFDDNIATVQVSQPFNERHFFYGIFSPDTTRIISTLSIGESAQNTVSASSPRHEYRVFVPQSAVGSKLNVGLRAEEPLFFLLQDPSRTTILRDSTTACGFERQFIPTQTGTYTIVVTRGFTGGDGPFTVGVNYAPCPSSPFLCGTIEQDSLYSNCLDYVPRANAQVATNDTVGVQAGTSIRFPQGSSITANGLLQGTATPASPIILKPTDGSGQQAAISYPRAINKGQSLQAEGKR